MGCRECRDERISVVERVQCELISDDCGNSKTAGYPEAEQTAGRKIYDHGRSGFHRVRRGRNYRKHCGKQHRKQRRYKRG